MERRVLPLICAFKELIWFALDLNVPVQVTFTGMAHPVVNKNSL